MILQQKKIVISEHLSFTQDRKIHLAIRASSTEKDALALP